MTKTRSDKDIHTIIHSLTRKHTHLHAYWTMRTYSLSHKQTHTPRTHTRTHTHLDGARVLLGGGIESGFLLARRDIRRKRKQHAVAVHTQLRHVCDLFCTQRRTRMMRDRERWSKINKIPLLVCLSVRVSIFVFSNTLGEIIIMIIKSIDECKKERKQREEEEINNCLQQKPLSMGTAAIAFVPRSCEKDHPPPFNSFKWWVVLP